MAVTPTYPGVYIEELPSGVRTIVGVATSITAFIGRALQGPVDEPIHIHSYADFERNFGGLWLDSTMSYAVRQYFQNGGSEAIIVRITDDTGAPAIIELTTPTSTLTLETVSAAAWGNRLRAQVATDIGGVVTVTVQEVSVAGSASPTVLNEITFSGSSVSALEAAFTGDETIVSVSGAFPPDLPSDAAWAYFEDGEDPAAAAGIVLPVTTETLTLEALTTGAAGNNLRVTIIHSATDATRFALVVDTVDATTGAVTATETHEQLTMDSTDARFVSSVLTADSTTVQVSGTPPTVRPEEVTSTALSGGDDTGSVASNVGLTVFTDTLVLQADNPGDWSNNLQVVVDHNTSNAADTQLFNLIVSVVDGGEIQQSENFRNVSLSTSSSRYVETVLEQQSQLVEVDSDATMPTTRPLAGTALADGNGSDGQDLTDTRYLGSEANKTGMYALEEADIFNILCIPPISSTRDIASSTWGDALEYCKDRRAMLIVDPPGSWARPSQVTDASTGVDSLGLRDENAILYYPRARMADPLRENRLQAFVPCGVMAGILARTDAQRGVWKAPAGLDTRLVGVQELAYKMTDGENGQLNQLGVNCLRSFPVVGRVAWGARTLEGADRLASEWKYVPVRRVALYIEESLFRGTQWVVFEPNDEPLWAQVRLNVGAFMHNLFRQGAFQGSTPREAYLVKCDADTTTQNDIDRGIVNILVGFAPLKPAEFVIIKIQQLAGQIET